MFWSIISDTIFLAYVPTARICYWGKVTMIRQTARTGHVRNVCETNNDADESKRRPLQWYMTFPSTRECQGPEQGLPALRWGSLCPKATATWHRQYWSMTHHTFSFCSKNICPLPASSQTGDLRVRPQYVIFSPEKKKKDSVPFSFFHPIYHNAFLKGIPCSQHLY